MLEQLIYLTVVAVVIIIPLVYFRRFKRQMQESQDRHETNIESGINEPVTLHPKIDPNSCIAIGACVDACPEGKILGIVDGKATIISPTKCIGHGACLGACPVDAITLVFGTESRGVEIPHVKENFESNVEGVYIAGELGGMGLIRNAMTQGKEAVEYIIRDLDANGNGYHDLAIIGAGAAGISATLQAKKEGLKTVTIEQETDLGGTVLSYPRQKLVMTQPMDIPLYGKFNKREIQKEELLELWHKIAAKTGITIKTGEKVEEINRADDVFNIRTSRSVYQAKRVLLTIGRRGTPRKLGVNGEKGQNVTYKLLEPSQYIGKNLLVVGGGDSAIEAAVTLGEQEGTTVSLSYRRSQFGRIKDDNRKRLETAVASGKVMVYMESAVNEIFLDKVALEQNDTIINLPSDYIFVLIGGEPPTAFLQKIGIKMDTKFGVK